MTTKAKTKPTTRNDESQQVMIRFPHKLLKRVDRYRETLQAANAHLAIEFTRPQAIRSLVTQALDFIEGKSEAEE